VGIGGECLEVGGSIGGEGDLARVGGRVEGRALGREGRRGGGIGRDGALLVLVEKIGLVGYGDLVVGRHQGRGLLVAGLFEVWLVVRLVVVVVMVVVVVLAVARHGGGCGWGARGSLVSKVAVVHSNGDSGGPITSLIWRWLPSRPGRG